MAGRDVAPAGADPTHYDLHLFPDLSTHTFSGTVTIHLSITKAMPFIQLHSRDLVISSAKFDTTGPAKEIVMDEKVETATIFSTSNLQPGLALLTLAFTGSINDKMCGFYRSSAGASTMGVTQFEAVDCRRAFPCFDEPARKASFDITITAKKGLDVISNMPLREAVEAEGGNVRHVFERAPRMCTYLVAWAVGEFEHVSARTKGGVEVRVFTRRGVIAKGGFALEMAARTLDFFAEYFGIPYALPKIDLIGIPDFAMGAMENWGLTTYREAALLFDPQTTSTAGKQRIAYIIAHELAHQWFGNLVSPEWWDALWLNEGFATWAGWLAVDTFYPDWKVWEQFQTGSFESALKLDALKSSHPIQVPVSKSREIDDIFDAISYCKGCSLIGMLVTFLGADVFRRGISAYLKKYSFGNAKTEDLWRSLGEASGKDVASYMDTWTAIVGFPLVTVSRCAAADGSSSLQVSQERFLADATAPRDTASVWPVPLKVAFYAPATSAPVIVETVMTAASATVKSPLPAYSHVKVNYGQSGFFRTQYSPELFAALAANVATLPTNDRAALLSDMDALARAGKASAVDALSLLSHYTAERDYSVWVNLSSLLGAIHFVWASEPEDVRRALDALGRQLLSNIDHAVGWDARPTDGHLDGLLRSLIVPLAAKFKDQATLAEAITRFDAGKVPNDVRGGIFPAVAAHSDAYLKKMQALLESSTDAAITVACVGALGAASTTEAVVDMLEYGLSSGKVRGQDYFYIWGSASSNPVGRLATWKFAVDNWDRLNKHLAGTSSLLGSCLSSAISGLTDLDMIKEAEDFLAARPVEGIAMTIKQAIEAARARARWLQRDRDHVRKFFKL